MAVTHADLKPHIVHVQPARISHPKPVEFEDLQHPTTDSDREARVRFEQYQQLVTSQAIFSLMESLQGPFKPKDLNELRSFLSKYASGIPSAM